MKTFAVTIRLTRPFDDEIAAAREREGQALAEWSRSGKLEAAYVRADMQGAFLFIRAEDERAAQSMIDSLPMRQWLAFETIECLPPGR